MTSWAPIDLQALAEAGLEPEVPTSLMRTDGRGLLYPGRRHLLIGAPESGKTWVALHAVAEVLRGEGTVLVMDCETDQRDVTRRLLTLGCSPDQLAPDRLVYVRPEEPPTPDELAALIELEATLVVLDGVSEAMALNGWDPRHEGDVASFYGAFAVPFAAMGATTLHLDHIPLGGNRELGSQHKRAGMDVSLQLVSDPWRPDSEGFGTILVRKDRPGGIDWRGKSPDNRVAAHVRFTPAIWGGLEVTLMPPTAPALAPTLPDVADPYLEQVKQGRHTAQEIAEALKVSESTARRGLQKLVPTRLMVLDGGRDAGGLNVADRYFLIDVPPPSPTEPNVTAFDAGGKAPGVTDQRHAKPQVSTGVNQRQTNVMPPVNTADTNRRHAGGGSKEPPGDAGGGRHPDSDLPILDLDEAEALARVMEMFDATVIDDA